MLRRDVTSANNPVFECGPSVLLLPFGRHSYFEEIVARCQGERVEMDESTDRLVHRLRCAVPPITLVYSGMGSPAAVNALEMVRANGARRVILFGACGGLDPRLSVGQLVVVSGAVRGEGASRYYAPPEFPAAFHPELVTRLLFESRHSDTEGVHLGVVYTTDAGYRQGPEIYETYAGLAIAVDSECAAVAVAAARLGLEAAALLFCTDNVTLTDPADRGYRGLRDPRVRLGFEVALEVCLRVLGSP